MLSTKTTIKYLQLFAFVLISVLFVDQAVPGSAVSAGTTTKQDEAAHQPQINGPFIGQGIGPYVFNGDLRSLPELEAPTAAPAPLRYTPGTQPKGAAPQLSQWVDPVAQIIDGAGNMPLPMISFAGLNLAADGAGWPPDTNGDVGPNHYIQTVNTSIGIFDKTTGSVLLRQSFNTFFQGPPGPCDSQNKGDPVVLYDPYVDRWIITDFAWSGSNPSSPFYECIAVSQSGNPVTGGWYYYAFRVDVGNFTGYLNDYPKLGVWSDGWYMSANMFQISAPGTGFGVRVWALDRSAMITGGPLQSVYFDLTDPAFASLLPANARGDLPPAGSPNYFASVEAPNKLDIWQFHVDWNTPANSTFTGPVSLTIADFATAPSVPQPGTSWLLDSLSFRLMMQLQYRNLNGVESLWLNHSVASGGVSGVRWYQVGNPGGSPALLQQGTYQPDAIYRWMGSLAVDRDGNLAVGYSAGSSSVFPGIRYAGRLAGETPNKLTQAEAVLMNGNGSQIGISRWGDYSAMTIDPADDCTFWYTNEYYLTTGTNWQTRIGAFRYPSCGQVKAHLAGIVRNSVTLQPVSSVPVIAQSATQTVSVLTDSSGYYTMTLLAGSYNLTAGPLLPGYPTASTALAVIATTGQTTTRNFQLTPVPNLVESATFVDDFPPLGNHNHAPEPGESGILLWEGIHNNGQITSTQVTARLTSLTPGVSIQAANASYADIGIGETVTNTTGFTFSVGPGIPCGTELQFRKIVTDTQNIYNLDYSLNASLALPRTDVFNNNVENGTSGWIHSGSLDQWAITTAEAHSPTHSWTDSPAGNYQDNADNALRTPAINLSGKRHLQISGWFKYSLESGYDYVYLEYSLNGGATWNTSQPLMVFNGFQSSWQIRSIDAGVLDGQPNVALRFHLISDQGVNFDGIYLDDIQLSYEPFTCSVNKLLFLPLALTP